MIIVNRDHKYPLINEYTGYIRKQRNLNSISQLKDYLIPSLNQKPQPQQ